MNTTERRDTDINRQLHTIEWLVRVAGPEVAQTYQSMVAEHRAIAVQPYRDTAIMRHLPAWHECVSCGVRWPCDIRRVLDILEAAAAAHTP